MTILATVTAQQSFSVGADVGQATAEALVLDSPIGAEVEQSFDGSAGLIQPRLQLDDGSGGQLKGVNIDWPHVITTVLVDGSVPDTPYVGDRKVGADLEACARTWELSVPASTGSRRAGDMASGPLGYEVERGGPPPGRRTPVSINVELRGTGSLAGTNTTIPVLTSGVVERSSRSWSRDAHILTMVGSGGEALYRRVEIDLQLDPDHGNTHGQIAVLALQAAEVPTNLIDVDPTLGAPRSIPIDLSCVALWDVLHQVMRPIGYVVMQSRSDGVFRAVRLDVDSETIPVMTITAGTAADIEVDSSFDIEADGTTPTCVTVIGHRLADVEATPESGLVTETVIVEIFEDGFAHQPAVARQNAGSSTIVVTGASPAPPRDNVLVKRVTVEVTTDGGCPVLEYTKTEEFFNPQHARYTAAASTTGEPRTYPTQNVYFFDSVPTADDETEGFSWSVPRFVVTSELWTEPVYGTTADGPGRKIGSTTKASGWKNLRRAIKDRGTPAVDWETENYDIGPMSAGFDGLVFGAERYFAGPGTPGTGVPASGTHPRYPGIDIVLTHLQVDVETIEVDECNLVPSTSTDTTSYGIRRGSLNLYANGDQSRDANEVGVTTTSTTTHAVVGGRPKTITTATDIEGRSLPTTVSTGAQGGIPAAEICNADEINRDREQTFSHTACIRVDDGMGGLIDDVRKPEELESRFVETPAEAQFWAELELRILHSYPVTLALASPAPILDVGDAVALDITELGFTNRKGRVWEGEITVDGSPERRIKQELMVRIPPVED